MGDAGEGRLVAVVIGTKLPQEVLLLPPLHRIQRDSTGRRVVCIVPLVMILAKSFDVIVALGHLQDLVDAVPNGGLQIRLDQRLQELGRPEPATAGTNFTTTRTKIKR